jgi:hypothetical protein
MDTIHAPKVIPGPKKSKNKGRKGGKVRKKLAHQRYDLEHREAKNNVRKLLKVVKRNPNDINASDALDRWRAVL